MPSNEQVAERIKQFFAENLKQIEAEGGHSLAPEVKVAALQQVLMYWRKLRGIAEKVTDTEVKLNLPELTTPKGRKFGIEGIVDIVRENDRTVMYDIKTHNADAIYANPEAYEKQLNVYAHIWQNLRGEPLDETAVICTAFPDAVREALETGDEVRLEAELATWNPLMPIALNPQHVEETIKDFGERVDDIEEGRFGPPTIEKLRSKLPGTVAAFGVNVCRNCDARFSCTSYREYVLAGSGVRERNFRQYYEDTGTDNERDNWVVAALDAAPALSEIVD